MDQCQQDFDLKERLVDKSVEAYILALETINRLTIQYRLETFCFLFCNAWELLLKAKLLVDNDDPKAIYYKREADRPKRSLSLRDCLNRILSNKKNPTRRNIERIQELRDESVHLVIGQIPSDLIRLFQAGVINYHKRLNEWFGHSLADRYPLGMMSIVYDIGPEQTDLSNQHLRRKLGPEAAEFLTQYCAELKREFDDLQRPAEFSVGVEYRLTLVKKQGEADIELSSGLIGDEPTRVIEVAKDPSVTHPFRQKELIEQLKEAIPETQINSYDVQCVNKIYRIKSRPEYFYQGKVKNSPVQYSRVLIDWLVKQYEKDSRFFHDARSKARKTREPLSGLPC